MPSTRTSAKALIIDNHRFLIVREKIGENLFWDLPGGGIKFEESAEDALKREVREELSLQLKNTELFGVWQFVRSKDGLKNICITYLCTPQNTKIDTTHNPANEEFTDVKWITPQEYFQEFQQEFNSSLHPLIEKLQDQL